MSRRHKRRNYAPVAAFNRAWENYQEITTMSDEQIANDLVENDGGVIVIEVDEGETQTQARSLIDPADWQWQRSVMDSKGREWWLKRYLVGEDGSKRRYLHFFTLDRPLDAERKYDMPSGYLVGWTRRGLPYLYKAG